MNRKSGNFFLSNRRSNHGIRNFKWHQNKTWQSPRNWKRYQFIYCLRNQFSLCWLRTNVLLLPLTHHCPSLPWWPCGIRRCNCLLAVSHRWGPALMAVWSTALPLTVSCLSPLRACPDGRVVYGAATDCKLSLTTEGLPWWLCGLRRCHWLLAVSHHWGPALMAVWSTALPLTVSCLSPLRACPDGRVVYGAATDCELSLTTEGLPWWPCGIRRCHWLLAVSHHWRPALMAVWYTALPLTVSCLSPLRACPDGSVVYGAATAC